MKKGERDGKQTGGRVRGKDKSFAIFMTFAQDELHEEARMTDAKPHTSPRVLSRFYGQVSNKRNSESRLLLLVKKTCT